MFSVNPIVSQAGDHFDLELVRGASARPPGQIGGGHRPTGPSARHEKWLVWSNGIVRSRRSERMFPS
jgi:hypothetical protein